MEKYRHCSQQKKDGSFRTILIPNEDLLARQHSLIPELQELPVHPAACAYVRGGSVERFAAPHHKRATVLVFDLEDFFPSISAKWLSQVLHPHFAKWKIAQIMDITTHEGKLPQGAATSPILSNIACFRLDTQLTLYAKARGAAYTRYADDIAFSLEFFTSEIDLEGMISEICFILYLNGFKVNQAKTKINPTLLAGVLLIPNSEGSTTNASN